MTTIGYVIVILGALSVSVNLMHLIDHLEQPRRGQQLLYALGHAVTSFPHSPPPAAGGRAAHFPRR